MRDIYIHGLGQNPSAWTDVISNRKEGIPAFCPDLAALLQGSGPAYANLYSAFSEYCGETQETLCLCGLSLGAVLALHYTIEHPLKVKSLVLIGAQYKMPRLLLKFQSMIFRSMKEASFQQMGFGKEEFIRLSDSMGTLDFSEDLKKIQCDTLVLCGERDQANKKAARELAAHLAHAKLQMIEGAGHEVNTDAPIELAAILDDFYRNTVL